MNHKPRTAGETPHPRPAARDFPYYAGDPVAISGGGWLLIMLALALAFAQLTMFSPTTFPLTFIPALLFTGLPILALMAVTGWRAPALYRPLGLKGLLIGLGFAVLTIVSSMIAGLLIERTTELAENSSVANLAAASAADLGLFLARTLIQLIGEELITILPLLGVLWLCVNRFGLSKRLALVIAIIVSTMLFAALHLPTYDWNIVQCFGTIGVARVVLTLAYVLTRNLWVSTVAHVANDWSLFLMSFAGGHLPMATEDLM